MKFIAVLIIITAIIAGYFLQQPKLAKNTDHLVEPHSHEHSPNIPSNAAIKPPSQALQHDHASHQSQAKTNPSNPQQTTTGNPHFDQLTPEMQQAVKDSLLLEGPMRTYKRKDGAIVLPANGRFTQMPVAVEMPDGSIEIREYSVVPKTNSTTDK